MAQYYPIIAKVSRKVDAEFIVAAKEDIARLVAEVRRLREALDRDKTGLTAPHTGLGGGSLHVGSEEVEVCDVCGHRPLKGNVVYESDGRRPPCPRCANWHEKGKP